MAPCEANRNFGQQLTGRQIILRPIQSDDAIVIDLWNCSGAFSHWRPRAVEALGSVAWLPQM